MPNIDYNIYYALLKYCNYFYIVLEHLKKKVTSGVSFWRKKLFFDNYCRRQWMQYLPCWISCAWVVYPPL